MELQWSSIRALLPVDLEDIARRTGALQRRRGVKSAEVLLRINLLYALNKASLAYVSTVAREMGLADLNPAAVFFRVRDSERFLEELLNKLLEPLQGRHRIRIADATVLCGPNAKGPNQRVHVCYDPALGLPISVEITDARGGEHFSRHPVGANTLILGDRGYGYAREILPILESGGQFFVRVEPCSNRFFDGKGHKYKADEFLAGLSVSESLEREVFLESRTEPLRLIGTLTPEGNAVFLLTNVPADEIPTQEAREFYRLRWQIELFFKRMKSLLDLGELRSREGPTARSWILAKFILAVLLVRAEQEIFSPREAHLKRLEEISGGPVEHLQMLV